MNEEDVVTRLILAATISDEPPIIYIASGVRRKTTPLRFTNSGRFLRMALLDSFSCRQCTLELIVSFLGSSSKNTIPFQSYEIDNVTFL